MSEKSLDDMTEPELSELFTRVAKRLTAMLPAGTGFIVLATPMGSHGIAQYVSNVRREDAADWMLETMKRWSLGDHVERK